VKRAWLLDFPASDKLVRPNSAIPAHFTETVAARIEPCQPRIGREGREGHVVMNTPMALSLSAMVERLPDLVNKNQSLLRRGRYITATDIMIEIGTQSYFLTIEQGRVTNFQRGPIIMKSWAFAVRGAEEAWDKFWQPLPPPNSHDIFALAKRGAFRIEGDYRPLITNLLYFKALLAAPRMLRTK
jgi:hypothetical protein